MISPDTPLYIYEVRGDPGADLPDPPSSFIGLWNEDDFSYLFFAQPEDDYVSNSVCADRTILCSRNVLSYGDWQTGLPSGGISVAGVRFLSVGHPDAPAGAIVLDPSVVFGDGNHPTTISCLRAMHRIVRCQKVYSLLDLGTGSGILALAGAVMGIRHILAVDKNRLAVSTARKNVRANALSSSVQVKEGDARFFIDQPFDVVTANLPFQVLRDLSTLRGVNNHRFWIVSGINGQQSKILEGLFGEQGYELFSRHVDPPWVTFTVYRACN